MPPISAKEIDRQYRVARQTLGIHGLLRDRLALKSRIAQIVLLLASVIFCAATFAADDLYRTLGLSPATAHIGLGLASILAFAFSVTLLVVNWKEAWADHREAARRWSHVVQTFRTLRDDDRAWPENARDQLNAEYWEAARTTVVIPENRFNSLKRRYLRKVAISEMSSTYPACPTILLALMLRTRHILHALKNSTDDHNSY